MLGRSSLLLAQLRLSRTLAAHTTCKPVQATAFALTSYLTCPQHLSKPKSCRAQTSRVGRLVSTHSTSQKAEPEQDKAPLPPGLYLVGTPIGNLEDLTVRALKVLQTATVILAEDTRHSRKLLNHYNIVAHLHSFHQHNEYSKQDRVRLALLLGAAALMVTANMVLKVSHMLAGAGPIVTRIICSADQ